MSRLTGQERDQHQAGGMQTPPPDSSDLYTESEWEALLALRRCYQLYHDFLSTRELARLRFVRWLYQTGRLAA